MNPLNENLITGTVGELLVQLRLFQFGVQAAPPLKDTGNDLIAVKDENFRAIQVKTTRVEDGNWPKPRDRKYHILALVRLFGEDNFLKLDECEVLLIDRSIIDSNKFDQNNLNKFRISEEVVDNLFSS